MPQTNKKMILAVMLICLLLASALPVGQEASANISPNPIQVIIDGVFQTYDNDQPPLIMNNRVMVPMRSIFERIGAEVFWDAESRSIMAWFGDIRIVLSVDSRFVLVDDTAFEIDQAPTIVNSRTLVPLRFVSETLGASVAWDGASQTVTVQSAAYIATGGLTLTGDSGTGGVTNTQAVISVSGAAIGMDVSDLTQSTLGVMIRQDISGLGYTWRVYKPAAHRMTMVGIEDNKVVAWYALHGGWSSTKGIHPQSTRTEVRNTLGEPLTSIKRSGFTLILQPSDENDIFELDDAYVTFHYDIHDQNKIMGVEVLAKHVEERQSDLYPHMTTELAKAYERQTLDFVNATRNQFEHSTLLWHEGGSMVGRGHSQDMATQGYFAHTGLDGRSPGDRLTDGGVSWSSYGENIAAGQSKAIIAHHGWMNSLGHRNNLLAEHFTHLGVGVIYDAASPHHIYYTQKFLIPR